MGFAGAARAEAVRCTDVNGLPAGPYGSRRIPAPGHYCLTADLSYTGPTGIAILIAADDVTLDLNGFTVDGGFGMSVGIACNDGATIRNGTVSRFQRAIDCNAFPVVVEDMNLDYNETGIRINFGIIRRNRVVNTGWAHLAGSHRYGIQVVDGGSIVIDNDIVTVNHCVCAEGESTGILMGGRGTLDGAYVVNNRITQADNGVLFDVYARGTIRDNLTSGVP
ncbi:MAG TPA: hypothetical protein VGV61_19220, partial [Thermoanaerobaculia bacterium]|nr:hypothetical protein [Thermoanaerobaculia bacterium]